MGTWSANMDGDVPDLGAPDLGTPDLGKCGWTDNVGRDYSPLEGERINLITQKLLIFDGESDPRVGRPGKWPGTESHPDDFRQNGELPHNPRRPRQMCR